MSVASSKRRLNVLVVLSVIIATVLMAPRGMFADSQISLEYQVTILRPENRLVHINLRVGNVDSGTLTFGRGETGGFPPREVPAARNLAAKNQDGYPLNLKLSGSTGRFIETAVVVCNGSVVLLEYDTDLSPHTEVRWYLGSEFGVVEPEYLFLFPIDSRKDAYVSVSRISVEFSVPQGWDVVTHWAKIVTVNRYEAQTSDELLLGPLGFGRFDLRRRQISNVEVTLAFYGYSSLVQEAVSNDVFSIYSYFSQLMGDVSIGKKIPRNKYLLIYVPKIQGRGIVSNREGAYGCFSNIEYPYQTDPAEGYWISWQAHLIFHEWSPAAFFGSPMWFSEGFTTYYQYKSTRDLKLISQSQFESAVAGRFKWYVERVLGTLFDKSLAYADSHPWEAEEVFRINYYKSCIVAYMLDLRIAQVTGGRRNLDSVMKYLFDQYALTGKRLSSDVILPAVNAVAGYDFTPFFEKYVQGTEKLPLRSLNGKVEVLFSQMPSLKAITRLELQHPPSSAAGQRIVMNASLRTLLGDAVANQTITFFVRQGQEVKNIGTARTGAVGLASLIFIFNMSGSATLIARYDGGPNYLESQTSSEIVILRAATTTATTTSAVQAQASWLEAEWPFIMIVAALATTVIVLMARRSQRKRRKTA